MDAVKARAILPEMRPEAVTGLEAAIDRLDAELEPLRTFILPGGTEAASVLHAARAVCRRGERGVVKAGERYGTALAASALAYLNRLSDLLFVMARVENRRAGVPEAVWKREHSLKEV
jgi:cob(I)alamin adenosyltransferase